MLAEPLIQIEVVELLAHIIPASAWRWTRRWSSFREDGVIRW